MTEHTPSHVVNVADIAETERFFGDHYGPALKCLTPSMRPRGGSLGVNHMRVPRGRSVCPFHSHLREDEVFFVLEGRGILRYGDELRDIGVGDCISCPAGTGTAHQIYNPYDEDLIYLAIGLADPHEVCTYPDSGKVLVRGVDMLGEITPREYYDGEPDPSRISELTERRTASSR